MVKRKFIAVLIAMATLCFFCLAVVFAKADTVENKVLVAGKDFVISKQQENLKVEGLTLFTGSYTNGKAGNDGLVKSFAYVLRGECIVVKFTQSINVKEYGSIKLKLMKNIESDAEFRFYKNASGETEAKESTVMNTGVSSREVELSLEKYANENGLVDSIIIEHYSDKLEVENKDFQILIYESELIAMASDVPAADYKLKINGTDMVNGTATIEGTSKKTFYSNGEKGKLYCNYFTQNSIAALKFGKVIDTADYKTLSLNIKIANYTLVHTFYLELYKTSEIDILTATPSARITIKSNQKTANVEINLMDFADKNGMVDGIVFYHLKNTRSIDYSQTVLEIYESNVYVREANTAEYNFPTAIENAQYINNFDGNGNNKLILDFERYPFTDKEIVITSKATVDALGMGIIVNGFNLKDSKSIVSYIAGYEGKSDKLAVIFNSKLIGDGKDNIFIEETAIFKFGAAAYTLDRNYDYVISYDADNVTVPAPESAAILSVTAENTGDATKFYIKFNRNVGNVAELYVKGDIYVNDFSVADTDGITVSADVSDNTVMIVSVPSGMNILNNDGTDFIKILKGFSTDRICLLNDYKYYRYDTDDMVWFKESSKELIVSGFEDYKDKSVLVKFRLKTNIDAGETITDISSSSALKKIKFNNVSLYDIGKLGEISITITGQYIDFIIERGVSGIKQNSDDVIVVEEGFALPTGGITDATKTFGYDTDERNFVEIANIQPDSGDNNTSNNVSKGCSGNLENVCFSAPCVFLVVACVYVIVRRLKRKNR